MSNREEFEKAYTNAFIGEELKGLESIIFARFEIGGEYAQDKVATAYAMWQARVPEGYKLVPCNPTEEMWGGLARHLVKYMQSHDRYCPKTLGKYINRFIGFKNIPDWLNKEIPDWESDHAFATADLGVFIYKAMIEAVEK